MASRWVGLLVLMALPLCGLAEPFGYAVNSDDSQDADQLLRVDMATGAVVSSGQLPFIEVEGLAFSPDGTLYGVDSASRSLITIDPNNASTQTIGNLGFGPQALDFGLTFTCSGELLLAAEQTQSLYRVDTSTGQATVIGQSGGLGASMTGLASIGDEVYGLAADTSTLHQIDPSAGTATTVGRIDLNVVDAGLSFDGRGQLWAILDTTGNGGPSPSRIVQIDASNGSTTLIAQTTDGIESLAVTAPGGCRSSNPIPLDANWALLAMMLGLLGIGLPTLRNRLPVRRAS